MKVYIVEFCMDYEQGSNYGVFATRKLAEKYIKNISNSIIRDHCSVREYEVEKEVKTINYIKIKYFIKDNIITAKVKKAVDIDYEKTKSIEDGVLMIRFFNLEPTEKNIKAEAERHCLELLKSRW